MKWNNLWRDFKKASPVLCTIVGVAGVIATAVFTAKNTPKAIELIEKKQEETKEPLKPLEKALAAAPAYLPAAGVGLITITAIVSSNLLSYKQNLSLAATCTILQQNFKKYKGEVKKIFGDAADIKIAEELAKDNFASDKVIHSERAKMAEMFLWFEPNTEQWFWETESTIYKAEYEVNHRIQVNGACTLLEYCNLLNIPAEKGTENIGWCYEDFVENWEDMWVDFSHSFVDPSDDDIDMPPYWVINTHISPEWDFQLDERPISGRLTTDEDGCYAWDVR